MKKKETDRFAVSLRTSTRELIDRIKVAYEEKYGGAVSNAYVVTIAVKLLAKREGLK